MSSCKCDSGGGTELECEEGKLAVCIELEGKCLGACIDVTNKLKQLLVTGGDYPKEIGKILTDKSGQSHYIEEIDEQESEIHIKFIRSDGAIVNVTISKAGGNYEPEASKEPSDYIPMGA